MSMVWSGADAGLHAALNEFSLSKSKIKMKQQVVPGYTKTTITANNTV
jgi:hypothetical protein